MSDTGADDQNPTPGDDGEDTERNSVQVVEIQDEM